MQKEGETRVNKDTADESQALQHRAQQPWRSLRIRGAVRGGVGGHR